MTAACKTHTHSITHTPREPTHQRCKQQQELQPKRALSSPGFKFIPRSGYLDSANLHSVFGLFSLFLLRPTRFVVGETACNTRRAALVAAVASLHRRDAMHLWRVLYIAIMCVCVWIVQRTIEHLLKDGSRGGEWKEIGWYRRLTRNDIWYKHARRRGAHKTHAVSAPITNELKWRVCQAVKWNTLRRQRMYECNKAHIYTTLLVHVISSSRLGATNNNITHDLFK